jgi:hypothetical protein
MPPLIAQLTWSGLGVGVALFFWSAGRLDIAAGFLVSSVAYGALSVAAFQGKRWAWWLSLVPPVFLTACVGPWAAYNFYAFFTDHPRYVDSPGTILIVGLNALVLLVPAVLVLILMVVYRKRP